MSTANRPPSRPASRTPAIPIPGAAPRDIENMLNINALSLPPGTPTRSHDQRPEQRQSRMTARSLYSGIEANRPTTGMRHASTSSVGSSRHALLGGTGPPWGARTVSASSGPVLPGSFGMHGALSNFEPRVIGGSGVPTFAERNGASSRQDLHASTSPTRRPGRMIAGSARPPAAARDIPIRSHSHRAPPLTASNSLPYTHHLGSGAPTTFKRPSYLQYSSLRDLLQTDTDASSVSPRFAPSLVSGRDVTPLTESDEDSESSVGFTRRPYALRERGRARERQSAYSASQSLDPMIRLPTRWNDEDRNKYLTISEDGRNLSFHGENTSF